MASNERRLALTVKGGVSLGAYEAGAITEVLRLVAHNNAQPGAIPWYIDTVAGASAGSITGAMLGRALTNADDVANLHDVWVNQISVDLMAANARSNNTILDSNSVWNLAMKYFANKITQAKPHPALRPGGERIGMVYTLSALGIDPVTILAANRTLSYYEYAATGDFSITVKPDASVEYSGAMIAPWGHQANDRGSITGDDAYIAMLKAAVTSGAFPIAFAPRGLAFWENNNWRNEYFVDGGVYDNDPVGESINLAHDIDWGPGSEAYEDSDRRFMIIHTEPLPTAQPWPPDGVVRTEVLDLSPLMFLREFLPGFVEESKTSGLRGIAAVNRKIAEREQILSDLCYMINTMATSSDFAGLTRSFEVVVAALARRRQIDSERLDLIRKFFVDDLKGLGGDLFDRASRLENVRRNAFVEIGLLVDLVANLADKVLFEPIVVAPPEALDGNAVYGFSGFFLQEIREHDFQCGVADAYQAFADMRDPDFKLDPNAPVRPDSILPLRDDLQQRYDASHKIFDDRVADVVTQAATDIVGLPFKIPFIGSAAKTALDRVVRMILENFL